MTIHLCNLHYKVGAIRKIVRRHCYLAFMEIRVNIATSGEDLEKVYEIRRKVFVEEQNCPPILEYVNEEESTHFIAYCDGQPCGAARWRETDNGYKLERFAVLTEFRSKRVGASLVRAVLENLPSHDKKVYLNSQVYAIDFYRPFGFVPTGDRFEEAGIMHQQMILEVSRQM